MTFNISKAQQTFWKYIPLNHFKYEKNPRCRLPRTSRTAAWPGITPCWWPCASLSGPGWHRWSGKHRSHGAPSGSMEAG